jgi:hypothetical protein
MRSALYVRIADWLRLGISTPRGRVGLADCGVVSIPLHCMRWQALMVIPERRRSGLI